MKTRRDLIQQTLGAVTLAPGLLALSTPGAMAKESSPAPISTFKSPLLKSSLNAFSFNDPLSSGTMSLEQMLEFCSRLGFSAVDITAYYIKNYPKVPDDATLYEIKRRAFRLGLDISGTGVRNDFTESDKSKRKQSVQLVRNWIDAAEKMGAPVIRIFAGNQMPEGYTRAQVLQWMLEDIQTCVEYGKTRGVVVAIQNHDDFIKTAAQAIEIIKAINSPWFGLILDTGSYRQSDPYAEIEISIPYAVNWQIKEDVYIGGKKVPTDLPRLAKMIKNSGYRGYLPIETLGEGDPKKKVLALHTKLNAALK